VTTLKEALAVSERAGALRRRQAEPFGARQESKAALIDGAP
jgi:hypothetical protein